MTSLVNSCLNADSEQHPSFTAPSASALLKPLATASHCLCISNPSLQKHLRVEFSLQSPWPSSVRLGQALVAWAAVGERLAGALTNICLQGGGLQLFHSQVYIHQKTFAQPPQLLAFLLATITIRSPS